MNNFVISGVLIPNHKGAGGVNIYIYIYAKLLENCYYKIVV